MFVPAAPLWSPAQGTQNYPATSSPKKKTNKKQKSPNDVSPANILHRAINTVVPLHNRSPEGEPVQRRQPAGIRRSSCGGTSQTSVATGRLCHVTAKPCLCLIACALVRQNGPAACGHLCVRLQRSCCRGRRDHNEVESKLAWRRHLQLFGTSWLQLHRQTSQSTQTLLSFHLKQ